MWIYRRMDEFVGRWTMSIRTDAWVGFNITKCVNGMVGQMKK